MQDIAGSGTGPKRFGAEAGTAPPKLSVGPFQGMSGQRQFAACIAARIARAPSVAPASMYATSFSYTSK